MTDIEQTSGKPSHAGEDATSRTVLVIDDELSVREALTDILAMSGLAVLTAADGRQGVELYEQRRSDVDVVLLDMRMPVMGGAEALRALRAIDPEVPVIVTSGYAEEETVDARAMPDAFLQKPFRIDQVVETVQHVLEQR